MTDKQSRIPIEQLKALPEFALLPATQQKFLAHYITNGYNADAAVKASYPKAKTPASIRVMGCRLLHSAGIVMLLQLHFGDDPKDAFCKMVAQMVLRGRITREQLEAIKLIADVREFRRPWAPRYENKIAEGMANNKPAVKKRVQRAAEKRAIAGAAEKERAPKAQLLKDFEHL